MDNIVKYFEGEKLQCIVGAVISLICISTSIYFLFSGKPQLKGLAYVVLPLSLFLLAICVGVIARTSSDIDRVGTFLSEAPDSIESQEIPRMEKVMKSFKIIKIVELVLLIIGLILVVAFWQNELVRGVAIGLVVMGISLYAFDHLAEARGEVYIEFLRSL